jgi:hypothetical protein
VSQIQLQLLRTAYSGGVSIAPSSAACAYVCVCAYLCACVGGYPLGRCDRSRDNKAWHEKLAVRYMDVSAHHLQGLHGVQCGRLELVEPKIHGT